MPLPEPLQFPPGILSGSAAGSAAPGAGGVGGVASMGGTAALASLLAGAAGGANSQAGRKQRELYVGNLPVGMVTNATLKELFITPLRTMPNFDESRGS